MIYIIFYKYLIKLLYKSSKGLSKYYASLITKISIRNSKQLSNQFIWFSVKHQLLNRRQAASEITINIFNLFEQRIHVDVYYLLYCTISNEINVRAKHSVKTETIILQYRERNLNDLRNNYIHYRIKKQIGFTYYVII